MGWRRIVLGARSLFRSSAVDRELDAEMRDFIERAADEQRRTGVNDADALRTARADFGSRAAVREYVRAGFLEWSVLTFLRDVKLAGRGLKRTPGFAAVAVLTLAVGLGATTALISVGDAVLFRPLPVHEPQQLVSFAWNAPPGGIPPVSIAGMSVDGTTGASSSSAFSLYAYERFRAETKSLKDVFAFAAAVSASSAPGLNDGVRGHLVSGNYFDVLGTRPYLGRMLTPDDDRENAPLVVVLGYRHWQQAFAADPAAIGKTMRFDRADAATVNRTDGTVRFNVALATIVGVAPPGFSGTGRLGDVPDFFMPLRSGAPASNNKFAGRMATAWIWPLRIMGRMKPDVTVEDVGRELESAFQASVIEARDTNPRPPSGSIVLPRLTVVSASQGLMAGRAEMTHAVSMLGVIVLVLLLIICTNLASLLFARGEARRAEMAVRLSLGAGRPRLVRQLVTEAVVITICGSVAGLFVAQWAKDAALAWMTRANPTFVFEPTLDIRVFVATASLAFIVGIVVGLLPAWRATRVDPIASLKAGVPGGSRGNGWANRSLLTAEVALSLVLLIGAGLFIRTARNLETADVGFNRGNLLLFRATRAAPPPRGEPRTQASYVLDELADRIAALPGASSAAFSTYSLLGGELAMPVLTVPGQPKAPNEDRTIYSQAVSPAFFRTMQMPIVLGREFTAADRHTAVAIVNETLARRFFPDRSAIGQRIGITKDPAAPPVPPDQLLEIVGVVRDAKYMTVREATQPTAFLTTVEPYQGMFVVRAGSDPMSLVAGIQDVATKLNTPFRATEFRTQAAQAALTFAEEQHFARIASAFGAMALTLTAIGLYGLLAYRVARQTRDIGVRIALGAARASVVRGVMRDLLIPVGSGVAIGCSAAILVTKVIQHLLFGVTPVDPLAISSAIALMIVVAGLAAIIPARRAAGVDPIAALRAE